MSGRRVTSGWTARAAGGLALGAVIALSGCAGVTAGDRPDGMVPGADIITREEIRKTGARDALEALQRTRNNLLVQDTGFGNRPRVLSRGVGSITLSPEVAVVIDGIAVANGVGSLRDMPVSDIAYMQVLTARQATPTMGATGGNGAVIIATRGGAEGG